MADNSNFIGIEVPVIYTLGNYRGKSLTLNFLSLKDNKLFSEKAIAVLKKKLGYMEVVNTNTENELKKKLESMLATGKYSTKMELAKAAGLSDSYVCRIMKYKK